MMSPTSNRSHCVSRTAPRATSISRPASGHAPAHGLGAERCSEQRIGEDFEIGHSLVDEGIGRAEALVDVTGVSADLSHPAEGGEKRDAGGVEAWPLGRYVDIPAVSRDAAEGQGGDKGCRPKRALLGSGPRSWRSGTANPANSLLTGDPTHDPGHWRHQVDVTVRVPGQREDPPGARQRCLLADLGRELTGSDAAAEKAFGELGEAEKSAVSIHQAPDRGRVTHRPPAHEIDV